MTYEEENELDALYYLEHKPQVSETVIVTDFFTELHINEPAVFFNVLVNRKFIESHYDNDQFRKLYEISLAGRRYLKYIKNKKKQEDFRYKLDTVRYWPTKYWWAVNVISGIIGAAIAKYILR